MLEELGFDVAEYLSHDSPSTSQDIEAFLDEWGVDKKLWTRWRFKRCSATCFFSGYFISYNVSPGKPGKRLGKTTGWIHRSSLKMKQVKMMGGITYRKIDDQGLHITVGGTEEVLEVDHIVICAGQTPLRELQEPLESAGLKVHLIGGADEARELDAKRAIDQGMRLGIQV